MSGDAAWPHSALGVGEGGDEAERFNWGLAGARNQEVTYGHFHRPRRRHTQADRAPETRRPAPAPPPAQPRGQAGGQSERRLGEGRLPGKRHAGGGRAGWAWEAPVTCSTRQLAPESVLQSGGEAGLGCSAQLDH